MAEQLTLDGQPVVHQRVLRCFQVDCLDFYAARDEAEARALHCEMNELEDSDIDFCCEVDDKLLDTNWHDEDEPGVSTGTLRQWLAEATKPCWLASTE